MMAYDRGVVFVLSGHWKLQQPMAKKNVLQLLVGYIQYPLLL